MDAPDIARSGWTWRFSGPNGAVVTQASPFRTTLAAMLLLAALLARAVIPSGWMVAPAPAGVAIVICTGDGMVTGAIPGKDDGQPRTNTEPCAFAGLGVAAEPPLLAILPVPVAVAVAVLAPAVVLLPGRGLAAPPPPATGPPAIA